MRTESEEEMAAARAAARERVVREFESAQTSLGSKTIAGKASLTGPSTGGAERGTKRKFDLDEAEIERLAKEATEEAMGRTALELAESRKAKLPNFWLVSLHALEFFDVRGSG
jgi:nitric oxide synthase-interacting protein